MCFFWWKFSCANDKLSVDAKKGASDKYFLKAPQRFLLSSVLMLQLKKNNGNMREKDRGKKLWPRSLFKV